ncbi:MAG: hypothetical protein WCJ30_02550 [Deltaproteobacteria bacterium]
MKAFVGLLRFVAISLLLVGAYVGYRVYFGAKIGEACTDSNSCAALFDVQCLHDPTGSYCTRMCAARNDCPTEWVCASAHDLDSHAPAQRVCSRATGQVRRAPR